MARAVKMLALVPAALLLCAPIGAQAKPPGADEPVVRPGVAKPLLQADRDYYFNNVARRPGSRCGGPAGRRVGRPRQGQESAIDRLEAKRSTGFPPAAKQLARREALATTQGRQPARDRAQVRPGQRAAGQAAHPAGRVQPRTPTTTSPASNDRTTRPTRPDASPSLPARCSTARCTTSCPIPATVGRRHRQQHLLGARLHTELLPEADLLDRRRAAADPAGPQRRHQHQRQDGQELLPRGVQRPLRSRGRASHRG